MNDTVASIKTQLKNKYRSKDFNEEGLIEITGASFYVTESYILTPPNKEYVSAELDWYYGKSRNVNKLFEIYGQEVKIWKDISSSTGEINSNYGWCIYSEENHLQYNNVYNELNTNPNSRRAVMIYTRPIMHYECNYDGMSDFICTNAVQYMIRDEMLHAVIQMRSNDAVFGFNNDYAWQAHVMADLAADLKVDMGSMMWQVGSLHVYPRHFHLLEN